MFFCSFPDELSRARLFLVSTLGAWVGNSTTTHIPQISEINMNKGVHLTYLKQENNQEWVFLLKTPQNYYSTALFSLKPVQVQKGSAYRKKETDVPSCPNRADSGRQEPGLWPTLVSDFVKLQSTLSWLWICPSLFIAFIQNLAEKCIIYWQWHFVNSELMAPEIITFEIIIV